VYNINLGICGLLDLGFLRLFVLSSQSHSSSCSLLLEPAPAALELTKSFVTEPAPKREEIFAVVM
ncbi:hypothetical protein ABKV19_009178, partial [Rosa sericea]